MLAQPPRPSWLQFITLALAVWAVAWNFYRDLMDRGRLRVHCYIGVCAVAGRGIEKDNLLVYIVTNIGRRPARVTQVGGMQKKGEYRQFIINTDRVPVRLEPGDDVMIHTDDLSMFGDPLEFLGAWDSLGKVYKVPKKTLRTVVRRVGEVKARQAKP